MSVSIVELLVLGLMGAAGIAVTVAVMVASLVARKKRRE